MKIARALVKGSADEVRTRMQEELVHFVAQLKSAEARSAFEAFMKGRG